MREKSKTAWTEALGVVKTRPKTRTSTTRAALYYVVYPHIGT